MSQGTSCSCPVAYARASVRRPSAVPSGKGVETNCMPRASADLLPARLAANVRS